MFRLRTKLQDLERNKSPICIGIAGAGETDTGEKTSVLIEQIESVPGITPLIVADSSVNKAISVLKESGIPESKIEVTEDIRKATKAVAAGRRVATENFDLVAKLANIQAILITTKDSERSAITAFKSIVEKKSVIMLNTLTDVTVGFILKTMSDNAGVVYTSCSGDEPGAALELCNFARLLGFKIVVAGKGKNNPLNRSVTPEELTDVSQKSGVSPRALVSFIDGTNTMLEMNALANAAGFIPDKRGMHGPKVSVNELLNVFCLKEQGGVLSRAGVVDYVIGDLAPGVFAIITTDRRTLVNDLKYLKMGEGPNYLLYRPYHLGNIEIPLSIGKAVLDGEPSISPLGRPFAETVAVAKRDMRAGEEIDDIGGYTIYGLIERAEVARSRNLLPLGLAKGAKLLGDIKKNESIVYDNVKLNEDSFTLMLRRLQDSLI